MFLPEILRFCVRLFLHETKNMGIFLHLHCKLLSHLSAHVVNHLLRENGKTIPKLLSSTKLFKNVTLQILNFIPVLLPDKKNSPYGVMLNFLCFFVLFNAVKTDTKLTLHHIGKLSII